jgi:hypothetical protein
MKNLLLCLFLLSITAQSFGQYLPTLREIYDFEIGDTFNYLETWEVGGANGNSCTKTDISYEISKNLSVGNTISYERSYSDGNIDTLTFVDSSEHFSNNCNQDFVKVPTLIYKVHGSSKSYTAAFCIKANIDANHLDNKIFSWGAENIDSIFIKEENHYYRTTERPRDRFEYKYRNRMDLILGINSFSTSHIQLELVSFIKGNDTTELDVLNINSSIKSPTIKVYPNPNSSIIHIAVSSPIHSVKLCDLKGQIVISKEEINTLNLVSLTAGIYIAEIRTEAGIIRKKVYKK